MKRFLIFLVMAIVLFGFSKQAIAYSGPFNGNKKSDVIVTSNTIVIGVNRLIGVIYSGDTDGDSIVIAEGDLNAFTEITTLVVDSTKGSKYMPFGTDGIPVKDKEVEVGLMSAGTKCTLIYD